MENYPSSGRITVMEFVEDQEINHLRKFLDSSTSPFHAINNAKKLLLGYGFNEISGKDSWLDRTDRNFFVKDGSIVAWIESTDLPFENGFRLLGAHTDSPNLRLKPIQRRASNTLEQLSIETYGSPLLNSWLDRDLGISGRVLVKKNPYEEVLFSSERPICRVPQLAIHLDRDINEKGLKLNPQTQLSPVWADSALEPPIFNEWLASQLSVSTSDIVSWDLMLHDAQQSNLLGAGSEWLASGRIDNLVSCYAAISALAGLDKCDLDKTPIVCLFDHEEVGSVSSAGASGNFLSNTLNRIMSNLSIESRAIALENSLCASVDGAHATHPNYLERHDLDHIIRLNEGIVIKRNANQRYATDAVGEAIAKQICVANEIPYQIFANRSDLSCGSTIGPTNAANLGVRTIDLGIPQLSMHSAREMCGVKDQNYLRRFCNSFLIE